MTRSSDRRRPAAAAADHDDDDDLRAELEENSDNPDDQDGQGAADLAPADDLYASLGVESSASAEEIRRAYRKLALAHHPDKAAADASADARAAATAAFQRLSQAYAVLSDPKRRARYDSSGSIEDLLADIKDDDVSWNDYFRELWSGVVTEQSIRDYESKFKFSEEERRDILSAYIRTKGDLLAMTDIIPLSTLDDIDRFRDIVQVAIDAGEIEHFKKFPNVSQRQLALRRAELNKEAKEVDASEKKKKKKGARQSSKAKKDNSADEEEGSGDEAALAALIKRKNEGRLNALIDRLESKYGAAPPPPKKKAKRKADLDDADASGSLTTSAAAADDAHAMKTKAADRNSSSPEPSDTTTTAARRPRRNQPQRRHGASDNRDDGDNENRVDSNTDLPLPSEPIGSVASKSAILAAAFEAAEPIDTTALSSNAGTATSTAAPARPLVGNAIAVPSRGTPRATIAVPGRNRPHKRPTAQG